jgi:hypothetical protein
VEPKRAVPSGCGPTIVVWAAVLLPLVTFPPGVRALDVVPEDVRPVTNNGQDPTRPRTQLEVLYEFQNLPGRAPDSESTFTLRAISRVPFDEHWSGSLRIDVPLSLTNAESSENPGGRFTFGLGDLLTQVAGIYTLDDRWAFAAGSQFTFSTASLSTTGTGKYVALPGAVFRYMLPELSPGSFASPEVLYQFDMGGDPHRHHLSGRVRTA